MKETTVNRIVLLGITVFLAAIFGVPYAAFMSNDSGASTPLVQIGTREILAAEFTQREQILTAVYSLMLPLAQINDPLHTVMSALRRDNDPQDLSGGQDMGPKPRMRLDNHIALLHLAQLSNIDVSRQEVVDYLKVLDKAHGGREKLKEKIRTELQITEQQLIDGLRDVMRVRKLQSFAVQHEMRADLKSAAEVLTRVQRGYDLRWVRLGRASLALTDKDLAVAYQKFYDANLASFTTPPTWMYEAVWSTDASVRQGLRAAITDEILVWHAEHHRTALLAALEYQPDAPGAGSGSAGSGSVGSGSGPTDARPVAPTSADLVQRHREDVTLHYLDFTTPTATTQIWDQVTTALGQEPHQSLRALSVTHRLEYRRSAGLVGHADIVALPIPVATGEECAVKVQETKVGTASAPFATARGRYLVRVLSSTAEVRTPYDALDAAAIERAAYDLYVKNEAADTKSPARYELEWVGVRWEDWKVPAATTTSEALAFQTDHGSKAFPPRSDGKPVDLAQVRARVEGILGKGGERSAAEAALGVLREAASKHAPKDEPEPDDPGATKPADPKAVALTPEQVLALFDLEGAARRAGFDYHRLVLEAPALATHVLVGDGGVDPSAKKPGWVSEPHGQATTHFVRLLAVHPAAPRGFEAARSAVRKRLIEASMKKAFEAHVNETQKKLLAGDFQAKAKEHGLVCVEAKRVKRAGDLTEIPLNEQSLVFGAVRGDAKLKDGQVAPPGIDSGRNVAYIVQLVAVHQPPAEELTSYELEMQVRQAQMQAFATRILDPNGWYGLMWFTGYEPMKVWTHEPKRAPDADRDDASGIIPEPVDTPKK